MSQFQIKLGSSTNVLNLDATADLLKFLTGSSLVQLNPGAMPLDQPIGLIAAAKLSAGGTLSTSSDIAWTIPDGNISLNWKTSLGGTVAVLPAGTSVQLPGSDQPIAVPARKAVISIALAVSYSVGGAVKFTSGNFGISANASNSSSLSLTNHFFVDDSTTIAEALRTSFNHFVFPLSPGSVASIVEGQFVEYDFDGKVALGAGIIYGFDVSLIGGSSPAEVSASFSLPWVQGFAKAKPQAKIGADLAIAYSCEGRFTLGATTDKDVLKLWLKKKDVREVKADLDLAAKISTGAKADLQLQPEQMIGGVAAAAAAELPPALQGVASAGIKKALTAGAGELQKFIDDQKKSLLDLVSKKIDDHGADLDVMLFHSVDQATQLLSYEFHREPGGAAFSAGLQFALNGDFRSAIGVKGVYLGEGSTVTESLSASTGISLHLFGANASSAEEFFRSSELSYIGGGKFRLSRKTGVSIAADWFGHGNEVDFFFLGTLTEGTDRPVIDLHFVLTDSDDQVDAWRSVRALGAIGLQPAFQSAFDQLVQSVNSRKELKLVVECVFDASAYGAVQYSPFSGSKPAASQQEDQNNWDVFTGATDVVTFLSDDLRPSWPQMQRTFAQWATLNRAWNGLAAGAPPNRKAFGVAWPDAWSTPVDTAARTLIAAYFAAGQRYMNLCEELNRLCAELNDASAASHFNAIVDGLDRVVRNSFTTFMPKAVLRSLLVSTSAIVADDPEVKLDPGSDPPAFSIRVRVKAAAAGAAVAGPAGHP